MHRRHACFLLAGLHTTRKINRPPRICRSALLLMLDYFDVIQLWGASCYAMLLANYSDTGGQVA